CVSQPLAMGLWSNDSAVRSQNLSVNPSAIGSCQERDDPGGVVGLPQTLEGSQLLEMVDHIPRLTFEEEFGRGRPGCDGVHCDIASSKLSRQDVGHGFYPRLGGGVERVRRLVQS